MKIEKGTIVSVLNGGLAEVKVGQHTEYSFYEGTQFAPEITIKALNPIGAAAGQHDERLIPGLDRSVDCTDQLIASCPYQFCCVGICRDDVTHVYCTLSMPRRASR